MQQFLSNVGGISLRQVLTDGHFIGAPDVRLTACCTDPESCRAGDLFVATVGDDGDTHEQAADAVRRGAAAVLAERLLPVGVPVCVVPDTREALGRVCQTLAGNPSQNVRVIGVSGTNGKTTTATLIASVLRAAQQRVGVTTTLGRCDAFESAPAPQTTPSPQELADWLARMGANGCTHGVVEVSGRGLSQKRLAGVQLQAAVMTNIRRDHLDYHGSVLNYRRTQARLFEHLGSAGFAVINADDPASQKLLKSLSCPIITVGMRQPAELTACVIERHKSEQTFLLSGGTDTVPVRTRMIGDHHVSNCLAAAAVGLVMGMELTTIARGLEAVQRLPARLDRIECGQEFGVYIDCADTPDRLAVSLRSLRQVTPGRVLCVYGPAGVRLRAERPLLGRVVEQGADLGVITSGPSIRENSLQVAHDVLDGYQRPARAHIIPTRSHAIQWALQEARPGDTVLIAGGDRSSSSRSREAAAADTEIARSWLYQASPTNETSILGAFG